MVSVSESLIRISESFVTFDEVRRLDHIITDVSEDIVDVLLGLDEDLKR